MNEFPAGQLPTKRQLILIILHEDNYLQKTASTAMAKELVDRWIWCNVYPAHVVIVASRIFEMITQLGNLDHWQKKRTDNFIIRNVSFEIFEITSLFENVT